MTAHLLSHFLSELDSSLLRCLHGDPDRVRISDVTADSRAVTPGAIFVAVQGDTTDGHRFIPQALEAGAAAVVGSRSLVQLNIEMGRVMTVPYLEVRNSRLTLAQLSAALHGHPSRAMTVIGVTGTDGKTTTSTLLESILRTANHRVGLISTLGARIDGREQPTGLHVTTPDAPEVQRFLADMRSAGCRFTILESTSHGLAQHRVGAVDFDVAIVTNITHEHLDYHGSYEAYREAKGMLFRALFRSNSEVEFPAIAVINADDPGSFDYLRNLIAAESTSSGIRQVRSLRYSLHDSSADLFAQQIVHHPDRTRFHLRWWDGEFTIESRLIGDFNVANVLAASGAALALGVPVASVQEGVTALSGVLGRMERIDEGQDFMAIVDFAHSPASLERALMTLRPLVAPDARLIAVFGSAGLRDRGKRRLMGAVSGRLADFTIVTAEDPRTEDLAMINREIVAGLAETCDGKPWTVEEDRARAIQIAVSMAQSGDVVASFGKGHERSLCIGSVEHPWNEQEVMRSALRRRLRYPECL